MSSRCNVTILKDTVKKEYIEPESFSQESENYRRLKDREYIPKLINIDSENQSIEIEKIEGLSIYEFVSKEGHLPYNLAIKLRDILLDMASVGIVDTPDFYKFNEHIFIVDGVIKIIDFDVNIAFPKDNKNYNIYVERRKNHIENEYSFLNGDYNSWNKFKEILVCAGFSNEIIDDFYQHMDK